jgi:predicted nucleotidyltransferase
MPATLDSTAVFAQRHAIQAICDRHGCGNVRIFGSVARGEAGSHSDVDLLVDITGETPQWFPGGLIAELEALLGRRVDITTPEGLNDWLRDEVLAEARPL